MYGFVQKYTATKRSINDYVFVPEELKEKLSEIFPARSLSQFYTIVPATNICHKCIEVEHNDHVFLSEVRVDYEHD